MTTINTRAALDAKIKGVCDVLRNSVGSSALQYVPELTWLLFLRFLDEREEMDAKGAKVLGKEFRPALTGRYRWSSWASPKGVHRRKLLKRALWRCFRLSENSSTTPSAPVGVSARRDAAPTSH